MLSSQTLMLFGTALGVAMFAGLVAVLAREVYPMLLITPAFYWIGAGFLWFRRGG